MSENIPFIEGYRSFRQKYSSGQNELMQELSRGQKPRMMVVSCCDSRVDPAILLQCSPGDLFVVRTVANLVPPYQKNDDCHAASTALEYGICYLDIEHLVILGHSQCGGITASLESESVQDSDFIRTWVAQVHCTKDLKDNVDGCARQSLINSHQNCLTFPWIKSRVDEGKLFIHLWFFDIGKAMIYTYDFNGRDFVPLAE